MYLLAGLSDSYEMMVTALEANTEVPNKETIIHTVTTLLKTKNQESPPSRNAKGSYDTKMQKVATSAINGHMQIANFL